MATAAYITGRKKWTRPQGILWSENPGTLTGGLYVPTGYEVGADVPENTSESLIDQFLILSDHNRGPMDFKPTRIEQRQRTVNGRMRSYHIADKKTFTVSWTDLPSRRYALPPLFNSNGQAGYDKYSGEHTADGGAGGVDLLNWYENHTGSFWMFLAYDKYTNFGTDESAYGQLNKYNEIIEVFFSDFSYNVKKRGANTFDLWDISVTLEEV